MNAQILCLGAAHIDIKAFAQNAIVWGTKNPVSTTSSMGGVARNVAENLARLGVKVALISRVGHDQAGDVVISELTQCGIDTSHVEKSATKKTASFTALLEPDGTLAVAFSDMAIYDEIMLNGDVLKKFAKASIWMADANVPENELIKLAHACPKGVELWAVGTSVAKNAKFLSLLARIDTLIVNEHEAEIFATHRPRRLVVTAGTRGVKLYEDDECSIFSVIPYDMVDSTGAGDAFAAGLAFGYLQEGSLKKALPFAMAMANITIKTAKTVCASLTQKTLLDNVFYPQELKGS